MAIAIEQQDLQAAGEAGEPSLAREDAGGAPQAGRLRTRPLGAAIAVFVIGLLVTAALAVSAATVYRHNENRLLGLRAKEVASVLSATLPAVQTSLASAAVLADATNGDPKRFATSMAPNVGPAKQFQSVSLWPLGTSHPRPVAVVGTPPALAARPAYAESFFAGDRGLPMLHVTHLLTSPGQVRVGYAYRTPGTANGFAAYAEGVLPKNRRSRLQSNSAFSDLHYILYLGRTKTPQALVVTDLDNPTVHGRQATVTVPFGDSALTLVVAPHGSLGGSFFHDLPWLFAILGALISAAAAAMTYRLVRRRLQAERLAQSLDRIAEDNRRLYSEQHNIAQTLQRALLPQRLPDLQGLRASVRYVPGVAGIDVGGDWYDVAKVEGRGVFIAVGDVSGRGLPAATAMATLRYASLAYAAQGDPPATVLRKLSSLVTVREHGHFASMLCGMIDVENRQLTLASAGHLAPLLIENSHAGFVPVKVGTPIGVPSDSPYNEVTVPIHTGATLIAFTDGLVERRGESLDVGLERLRKVAISQPLDVEELLTRLTTELAHEGAEDDTAILGIRWQS